jgi:hypothetical protein
VLIHTNLLSTDPKIQANIRSWTLIPAYNLKATLNANAIIILDQLVRRAQAYTEGSSRDKKEHLIKALESCDPAPDPAQKEEISLQE